MIIYLVMRQGGEYEDKYSYPIHAWTTREAAEMHCVELLADKARLKDAHDKLDEYYVRWSIENPHTNAPLYPAKAVYPKWGTGPRALHITESMRAERDAIKAEYNAKVNAYHTTTANYEGRRMAACAEYFKTIGLYDLVQQPHYYRYGFLPVYPTDEQYEIEELDLD